MRADDEQDPLDRWLNQQVKPLPPPPGTFELITRRARGRKLRKLAVTVLSAAAVAAAVAFAVPAGLNLRLSPTPDNGRLSAEGSPTSPARHSPEGAASRLNPSPSGTAIPAPAEPSGPVPANFQPSSVTFVSQQTGWVIGQAGTPGQCANANPDICTSIARTDNAGHSWQGGPAPDTGGPSGPTGVSGIRFLNGTDGWAFGPELWATHDEGKTWTQVATDGARVTDLEASGGRAYALFATCSAPENAAAPGFAADCTSYTLMTAAAAGDDWVPVGGSTSGLTNGGGATSAVLELTGSNGYLLAPDGTLYSGPIGGTWTRAGTAPCQPGYPPNADGLPGAALLALVNSTQLAMTCNGASATAPPTVYTSNDGGALWTEQPAAAWSGLGDVAAMTSLAAAPDGALVLATTNGIYYLPAGASQWKSSGAAGSKGPSGGFTYVGMTTDGQGVALPADTSPHEIWMTFDGGRTWNPATSITPGS
jgi:hypothetical protein